MGQSVILVVLWLGSLIGDGLGTDLWSPSEGRKPSIWESLGSRYSAPGIVPGGSRSQAVTRAVGAPGPVVMRCREGIMEVTAKRDFFGTGRLIQAADLRLGPAFCRHTSINASTVTFQVKLQDCGNTLQITSSSLVYNSVLTYNPSPPSDRAIIRDNQIAVLIQCIYPRNGNVSSDAIKPTWDPYRATAHGRGILSFSLRLMTEDWITARTSTTFQLGDVFNIEASVLTGDHAPMRIFVDSCVATLNLDKGSLPRYEIIAANGCLIDGMLSDSSSAFMPRSKLDVLQFKVDAFRFMGDTRSMIYITCNLKAIPHTQGPDSMNKACSHIKASNGWSAVEGPSSNCGCCQTGNCALPGQVRAMDHYRIPGSRGKRTLVPKAEEMVAVLGPLVILNNKATISSVVSQRGRMASHGTVKDPWPVLGASAVVLSFVLGSVALYKRSRGSY